MPRTRLSPQLRWLTIAAAAAGLMTAGCGQGVPNPVGSGKPSSPSATSSSGTKASTDGSAQPTSPLTGLPAASPADAAAPAVAVIVSGADPAGLGSADVVFQDISGSTARYLAVFQSRSASAVGPVTTTQPEDGQILSVLHPLTAYDGGTSTFVKILDHLSITDVGEAAYPSAYTTTPTGSAVSTTAILHAVSGGKAPPPLFRWRGSATGAVTLAPSDVSRPTSVRLSVPGWGSQSWTFDASADRWVLASGGPRVEVANLVVQTVGYKAVYQSQRYGITVPSARVLGTGRATVFSGAASGGSGGTAASGTWSKPHLDDVTNYFASDGQPMAFLPGPTWVILVPAGTQIATSG